MGEGLGKEAIGESESRRWCMVRKGKYSRNGLRKGGRSDGDGGGTPLYKPNS